MSQSRSMSFIESLVNVSLGFVAALISQILIFPFFNINIPFHDNVAIGLIFTVISIIRSYIIRRCFNAFGEVK